MEPVKMTNFNPEKVYAVMIKILEQKYNCKIEYEIVKKSDAK